MSGDRPLSVAFLPFCRESGIGQNFTHKGHSLSRETGLIRANLNSRSHHFLVLPEQWISDTHGGASHGDS